MLDALGRGWLDPRSSVWAFNGRLGRLIPLIRRWHPVERQRLWLLLLFVRAAEGKESLGQMHSQCRWLRLRSWFGTFFYHSKSKHIYLRFSIVDIVERDP